MIYSFNFYLKLYALWYIANTVDNLKTDTLESGLKNMSWYYTIRGLNVVVVLVDIQFKYLKD